MAALEFTHPPTTTSVNESTCSADLLRYTPDQLRRVLETLAVQAEALRDFLGHARLRTERDGANARHAAGDLYVAEQLATLIGAVADHLSGHKHIGTVASWAVGDDIEEAVRS